MKRGAGRETERFLRGQRDRTLLITKRERTFILLLNFRVLERGHAGKRGLPSPPLKRACRQERAALNALRHEGMRACPAKRACL
jgi:hypothetical protein